MLNISTILALALSVSAISYLSGCCSGAIITSSLFYHDDVRQHGSKNAGLTNFYRTFGARYALCVIGVDMLKCALAVWVGNEIAGNLLGLGELGKIYAALWCVVGHMFPAFYSFKGGKGILCSGTLLLFLDWRITLVGWGLFVLLWLTTRYVSLGSVCASLSFPVMTFVVYRDPLTTGASLLIALLVLWAHRENISRLLKGTERKFEFHPRNKE